MILHAAVITVAALLRLLSNLQAQQVASSDSHQTAPFFFSFTPVICRHTSFHGNVISQLYYVLLMLLLSTEGVLFALLCSNTMKHFDSFSAEMEEVTGGCTDTGHRRVYIIRNIK